MSRRGRGEGSIFERKDGTWAAVIDASKTTGDGSKRRRVTVYGSTKTEVMAKLQTLKVRFGNGVLEPSRVPLADFLDRWLEEGAKPTIRDNSYQRYVDVVKLYLKPYIGAIPLDRLAATHVHSLMAALDAKQKSPRTKQLAHATLRRALNKAVAWRLLSSSPMTGIDAPKYVRPVMQVLDRAQAGAFLDHVKDNRLSALFVLAISCGMRQGEILGLQWSQVDLERARLTVRHTLTEKRGRITGLTEPKSKAGTRVICLPAVAVRALRKHRELLFGEGLAACAWVFPNSEGQPFLKSNFMRGFKALRSSCPTVLPQIRFHDLRHTCATLLLESGVQAKTVQEMLGHANIALTLQTYAHVLPSMRSDAAAKMDEALGGGT